MALCPTSIFWKGSQAFLSNRVYSMYVFIYLVCMFVRKK